MHPCASATVNDIPLTGGTAIFVIVCMVALFALQMVVVWRIVSKAGYSGILSLLALVPIVNFFAVIYFAFDKWPLEYRAGPPTLADPLPPTAPAPNGA